MEYSYTYYIANLIEKYNVVIEGNRKYFCIGIYKKIYNIDIKYY